MLVSHVDVGEFECVTCVELVSDCVWCWCILHHWNESRWNQRNFEFFNLFKHQNNRTWFYESFSGSNGNQFLTWGEPRLTHSRRGVFSVVKLVQDFYVLSVCFGHLLVVCEAKRKVHFNDQQRDCRLQFLPHPHSPEWPSCSWASGSLLLSSTFAFLLSCVPSPVRAARALMTSSETVFRSVAQPVHVEKLIFLCVRQWTVTMLSDFLSLYSPIQAKKSRNPSDKLHQ